jgi:16S rRNA processing protein RimM
MPQDAGERTTSPEHLVVGHISKAHGTRGEVFVWPLTDRPDEVFVPGRALLLGNQEGALPPDAPSVVIESSRPFKGGILVKFEELGARTEADPVAQRYLLLPVSDLLPLAEDELFYHELLGCVVETVSGERVGIVREVFETEPNHLLEVKSDDGRLHLVPFAKRIVREIDRAGRRVVIDPPEGLLELN